MNNDKKITKQDLKSVFWRIQTIPFSYNYEKLFYDSNFGATL